MATETQTIVGMVTALWRYPVKSMMGEELNAAEITQRGVLGDRVYALTDPATNKVVSAKHPSKWARMFECRASFIEPPRAGTRMGPVRITLPDGTQVISDRDELGPVLSRVLGRKVTFSEAAPSTPSLEEYWPNIEGLAYQETVTNEAMPSGMFFDATPIHLLTTATIDRLRALYPQGRFEVRRFRPNIVVAPASGLTGFVENDWVGRTVLLGEDVRLQIVRPCPRCVMTTLPQGDLPQDYGILRVAAQHNQANVGVYATVARGGEIRRGDSVRLVPEHSE